MTSFLQSSRSPRGVHEEKHGRRAFYSSRQAARAGREYLPARALLWAILPQDIDPAHPRASRLAVAATAAARHQVAAVNRRARRLNNTRTPPADTTVADVAGGEACASIPTSAALIASISCASSARSVPIPRASISVTAGPRCTCGSRSMPCAARLR